jgi:TIR domain-containing protein
VRAGGGLCGCACTSIDQKLEASTGCSAGEALGRGWSFHSQGQAVKQRLDGRALLRLVDRCLREGASIEIDGMGSFLLNAEERVVFEPSSRGRVFLAYAEEDRAEVRNLYTALQRAGFEPWMDKEKLLPGQNWPRAIDRAIDLADFFVGCFSHRSTVKRGHFQRELGYALDVAASIPAEDIFFIPVRLEACDLPRQIVTTVQYVDLFPDWDRGVRALIKSLRQHWAQRKKYSQRRS